MCTQSSAHHHPCLVLDSAMHPMAPRSPRHAALLVLAHNGAPRPHALPCTPITAPSGAFTAVSRVALLVVEPPRVTQVESHLGNAGAAGGGVGGFVGEAPAWSPEWAAHPRKALLTHWQAAWPYRTTGKTGPFISATRIASPSPLHEQKT